MLEGNMEGRKFQHLRVTYSSKSGIDSIVETLKLLKGHGVDTRRVKTDFSQQEFFAVLEIETEVCFCLKNSDFSNSKLFNIFSVRFSSCKFWKVLESWNINNICLC